MRRIYKYQIPIEDQFSIKMPVDAHVLHVNVHNGVPCIWALVNPDEVQVDHEFQLRGTGHPAGDVDLARYVGTFFMHNGGLVFHLFEESGE